MKFHRFEFLFDLFQWGFRRVEDICWLKTNHENTAASETVINDRGALFKRTKVRFSFLFLVKVKSSIYVHFCDMNP
jgi:hypothetical protein